MTRSPSPSPGPVWAIVVAGGRGLRFGRPKQFEVLAGRRVLDHSLAAARAVADGLVLVVPGGVKDAAEATVDADADVVVEGGVTRSDSVRAGLAAVPEDAAVILVHDAARPLASVELFRAVVEAVLAGADAVVPVLPVTDTLRELDGPTVDRARFVAVQTPQGFRAGVLRAAHRTAAEGSDDASLVEAAGWKVVTVPGEPTNRKITDPRDLVVAEALLAAPTSEEQR